MENNEYLDFDEAVRLLKTTPSTLYKWLQAGKIPGHKLGRQWRFLRDELEIHVSGKGSKIQTQRDFLNLSELLTTRSKNKELKMELTTSSISEKMIWDAFDHGSRIIHIYPSNGKYEISYRSDFGMEKLSTLQEESFLQLDQSLQELSSPIEAEDSRRLNLHRNENDILQVTYQKLNTVTGPRLTLRLWKNEKDILPLEKISSDEKVRSRFKSWTNKSHGLFIVSGATGSGKTTTVYALLNELKNQGRVVFTLEETAQLIIDGINQVEIKTKDKNRFLEVFDKIYSSDPDVICLGLGSYFGMEEQVFNEAYRAASTGHFVILQMDQPSFQTAIDTFIKYCKYPLDQVLAGVSCQKLVEGNGKVKAVYEFD